MKLLISVAACLIATLPATVSAQVYQWKDANGRTVISDSPPPSNAKNARSIGGTKPVSKSDEAAAPTEKSDKAGDKADKAAEKDAGPQSTAEKDMAFKKRQQEAKEKAEKDAKEKAAANDRKENCERAKRQLTALESGERFATYDEKGGQRPMHDEERQQELERSRRIVAENCK